MDPNPTSQPILSYVLSRLPPSISFKLSKSSPGTEFDLENPKPVSPSTTVNNEFDLADTMPGLKDPALLAALSKAVSDVDQTRSVLRTLGPRPDHEVIDKAKARAAEIDADLSQQLEVIVLSPRPDDVDHQQWGAEQAEKEMETREAAEKEKIGLRALLQLDEMHEAYEGLLTEAEQRLNEIYRSAMENPVTDGKTNDKAENQTEQDEINDEVTGILEKGKILDRVDLSDRQLKHLPDAFAKLNGLVSLNLSNNQLENVPDIIGTLESLEELCISNNILTQLPDSMGLMTNLKILNVSGNKLKAIPDSIAKCRSLVELDASYNQLAYLPTNIGVELINLQILRVHLNKLRSLPSSICKMVSLRLLDAHFNELHGLPSSIGELSNLETLNLSSNFSDLQELPVSFGELLNLKDVDLSNNQIRVLPASFGRLEKLKKLNLDQNPLEDPPIEIVSLGIEAVKNYMSQKWLALLVEIEEMDNKESGEGAGDEPVQMTWLTRTVSSVKGVAGSVAEYLSPRANKGPNRESYLDQEF